ncbi:MAG TPA: phosphatase PAP2 family protein [Acidimicrobiales bacterium]|nr:phosphatase PAP2 family protein [Acidimicrobiales bacterium]
MRRARVLLAAVVAATVVVACGSEGFESGPGGERKAGTWKTWVLSDPDDVRVPEPPSGEKADAEAAELQRLAAARTPEIEERVKRWNPALAVKPWIDLHLELVAAGVKDPPLASRGYSLTTVAIYDALVAAYHWKYEYERTPPSGGSTLVPPGPDPSYPSEHAVIAGAASRVLTYLFPERAVGLFDRMAEEAAESRVQAGANFRSDVEAGLVLGRAVADKVLARARADGSDREWDGSRPPGVGRGPQFWEPPPGSVTPPTQPLAGTWKTWVLRSGDQFRPPRPPAIVYGSPEHVAELREVMDVRARITPEQERIARFWVGGQGSSLPPGLWNQVALVYLDNANDSAPRAARVLAALNVAEHDAAVAVWDTKFAYWSPRPINAIRDLGLDPNWRPLLTTPTFPGFVSGHSGYSAAAADVLSYFFPSERATFQAKADEAALSRLYAGIHPRADNEYGAELGHKVGQAVVERIKHDGADV